MAAREKAPRPAIISMKEVVNPNVKLIPSRHPQGAQVARLVAIAPFLAALMIFFGTTLSSRTLPLALVVLVGKTKRTIFVIM